MAANEVLACVADVAASDLLAFIDVDEQGGVKVAEGAAHFLAPRKHRWPLSPDDKQDRSDVDCLVRASHNEPWSMRRHGSPPGVERGVREGEVPIRISCESRVRRNVRGRSRSSLRLDRPACTALMTLISPLEAESWRRQSRSPTASNHSLSNQSVRRSSMSPRWKTGSGRRPARSGCRSTSQVQGLHPAADLPQAALGCLRRRGCPPGP